MGLFWPVFLLTCVVKRHPRICICCVLGLYAFIMVFHWTHPVVNAPAPLRVQHDQGVALAHKHKRGEVQPRAVTGESPNRALDTAR